MKITDEMVELACQKKYKRWPLWVQEEYDNAFRNMRGILEAALSDTKSYEDGLEDAKEFSRSWAETAVKNFSILKREFNMKGEKATTVSRMSDLLRSLDWHI